MTAPVLGLDVSKWQTPNSMRWALLRELGYSFVYIRGVRMGRELDTAAHDHVRNAREAGFAVGLYSFFDPRHTAEQQIALTLEAHRVCGVGPGDLAPALDLEGIDGGPQASPAWVAPAIEILDAMVNELGASVRYHNVGDWHRLGRPAKFERYPLWLADYTPPADLPCVVWQQRSAPIAGYGATALDQNATMGDLPTIGPRVDALEVVSPATLATELAIPWPRFDAAEHAKLRNAQVARDTDRETE
jgi:GH25 family lysozyme M1 (1,4-beta-N-acetylmuramidase)